MFSTAPFFSDTVEATYILYVNSVYDLSKRVGCFIKC